VKLETLLPRRAPAIPLADAASLRHQARRTLAVRLVLATLLIVCLLTAIGVARASSGAKKTFFGSGQSTVLVIDSSSSVDAPRRALVGRALGKLVDAHSSFGIVFFSDTAYEAVPPNTRWTEIEPLLRFFHDAPPVRRDLTGRPIRSKEERLSDPWVGIRAGTSISTGLGLARTILQQEHHPNAGVLLMSDLDNSVFDNPLLTRTLTEYAAEHIPLRVLPLKATREDEAFFATALGKDALVTDAELAPSSAGSASAVVTAAAPAPTSLVGAALILLLLLGANEHWAAQLRWRDHREEQP
jgi:hypothetical protein